MGSLPHVIDHKDIIRGKIFRTAFPFLEERPLLFFEKCDKNNGSCCPHEAVPKQCGRVVEKNYGFESGEDDELLVLTRFKARYAIVLSTPVLNQNANWPNVIIAPIVGIHDDELHKSRIQRIMKHDISMFTAFYLDVNITGMHCYIDLGKIRPAPKNWLLQEKAKLTDTDSFNAISERIGLLLAQKQLADCKNCKKPCDNCGMRIEVEQLRKQLEQQVRA